jgi:hypothetical protein
MENQIAQNIAKEVLKQEVNTRVNALQETVNEKVAETKELARSTTQKVSNTAQQMKVQLEAAVDKYVNPAVAYEEALMDRKRDAYTAFVKWEEKRANLLNIHRRHLDVIMHRLDVRTTSATDCFEMLIKFFKQRAEQEEAYSKGLTLNLPKLESFFSDPKSNDGRAGILPKAFKEYDEFHTTHARNSQLIAEFINKQIVDEVFSFFLKEYSKKIEAYKKHILEKKKALIKANKDTQDKATEYGEFCVKVCKGGSDSSKTKDMYEKEWSVMQMAKNQMKLEGDLGKDIMDYIDNLKRFEVQRLEVIKKGLTKYLNKMGEMYGKSLNNPDVTIKVLEAVNPSEDVERFFDVSTFFNPEDLAFLKKIFPKAKEIGMAEMKEYVETFNYRLPHRSALMMKEWKICKEGGVFTGLKPYLMIATVDYNLVLMEDKDEITKPEKIMKMTNLSIASNENRRDTSVVDVLEVVPGLIMDSKNKVVLKFDNCDTAEEFIHFITNYQLVKEKNSRH